MPATPSFTVEEITTLQVSLNAAMEEATKKGINIPLDTMLSRLFGAAANGERDPEKLKEATATSTKNSALGMQTSEDSGGRR